MLTLVWDGLPIRPRQRSYKETPRRQKLNVTMGRWPDDSRLQLVTYGVLFVLFPLFCWLAWWFVKR
jgi:hypothetical protein